MAAAIAAAVRRRDAVAAAENDSPKSFKSEISLPRSPTLKKSRSQAALDLPPPGTGFWRYQRSSAVAYTGMRVQLSVAALIAGNFLMNVIEKWIDPDGDIYPDIWVGADIFFNVSFAIELVWNMYSFWLCRFWKSAWNVFDVIVVTIGLMNLAVSDLPGPLSLLRMMRAFRVFRLFKRVESLHKIMKSLSKAVPGVSNACLILLLVMSIYAILGVEFFGTFANGGNYTNELGQVVEIITARELPFGDENFGNFHRSLYTMFQVLTGESWSEVVTRPMLHTTDFTQAAGTSLFFVSFYLVNGVVLINVVIAVLLEKMVDDEKHEPSEEPEASATVSEAETENRFHVSLQSAHVDPLQAKKPSQLLVPAAMKPKAVNGASIQHVVNGGAKQPFHCEALVALGTATLHVRGHWQACSLLPYQQILDWTVASASKATPKEGIPCASDPPLNVSGAELPKVTGKVPT
ncbi:Cacna1i [Symbiodinium natans]|uniref:Cacna1i protein n=1 Tax=Symbiodinium natans TaxID=878477 RepID=A0A812GRS5_9DINO|nr:Cacna1i [Symbiodinium natans]